MMVLFAPEAEEDFSELVEYLAQRNPKAAAELGRKIFPIIDKLAARQLEGQVTTLQTGEIVHSWAVPPVRIYYQRHDDTLWIVRIYHQARPPIAR